MGSRRLRWAGYVACMGDKRGAYSVGGETGGKESLVRPRFRWKNNMKIYLQEEGWGSWSGLIWLSIGTCGGRL